MDLPSGCAEEVGRADTKIGQEPVIPMICNKQCKKKKQFLLIHSQQLLLYMYKVVIPDPHRMQTLESDSGATEDLRQKTFIEWFFTIGENLD